MERGHIDEVCWLFNTSQPTKEQIMAYDILLEMNGWDLLDPDDDPEGDSRQDLLTEAESYLKDAQEIAKELFDRYSIELADSLEVNVTDLPKKTQSPVNSNRLTTAQCVSEAIAWHCIKERWNTSYPTTIESFWNAVQYLFEEMRYEYGY